MVFKKVYNDAQIPVIKTKYSAGIDLYSYETISLRQLKPEVVGTGVWFDKDGGPIGETILDRSKSGDSLFFILELRSSLRAKGITSLGAGIIDFDYSDEWKVVLCNVTKDTQIIEKGERIAQAVLLSHFSRQAISQPRLPTEERKGGFGSTGN
jgi:dUTP pyrophosphatase